MSCRVTSSFLGHDNGQKWKIIHLSVETDQTVGSFLDVSNLCKTCPKVGKPTIPRV
jgi:hypothetical protein